MGDCISWCNPVFKRVEELPSLEYATRNHAYIMPDNKAYILNEAGDGFIELVANGGGGSVDLSEYAKKSDIIDYKAGDKVTIDSNTISVSKEFSDKVDSIEAKADDALAKEYKGSGSNGWIDVTKDRVIKLNQNFLYDNLNIEPFTSGSRYLSLLENLNGYGLSIRFNSDSLRNDIVGTIPSQKTSAVLVESSTPTDLYSFRITPYGSMIKKDNSLPAGDAQIIYNATINPFYESGIIKSKGTDPNINKKEFNLTWQQLYANYGVIATVGVQFKEIDLLGKKSITLGSANELYLATQDLNDNVGLITKAGQRSKGKTIGNFTINNGMASARVDVTYYKIILE